LFEFQDQLFEPSARNEAGSDQIYEDMPGLEHYDIHESVCISNILFLHDPHVSALNIEEPKVCVIMQQNKCWHSMFRYVT
jgi:hypothetical protein